MSTTTEWGLKGFSVYNQTRQAAKQAWVKAYN